MKIDYIVMHYVGRDFFGIHQYKEDKCYNPNEINMKDAWKHLKNNRDSALHIYYKDGTAMIYTWDSLADFENQRMLCRYYSRVNAYTDTKMNFVTAKKDCLKIYK